MGVTVSNLIMGPGTMYKGVFGAVEPLDTAVSAAPSSAVWTDLGGTQDGVTVTVDQQYTELEVDQIVEVPERRLTRREFMLETNLAEPTLDNLGMALNTSAPTTGTGYKALEPAGDTSATQPTYISLIFDGFAPSSFRRRVIGRRMLNIEGVGFSYKKDGQTVFPVKWNGHYVSSLIKSFKITDQV